MRHPRGRHDAEAVEPRAALAMVSRGALHLLLSGPGSSGAVK
jgi:hypothetical protein